MMLLSAAVRNNSDAPQPISLNNESKIPSPTLSASSGSAAATVSTTATLSTTYKQQFHGTNSFIHPGAGVLCQNGDLALSALSAFANSPKGNTSQILSSAMPSSNNQCLPANASEMQVNAFNCTNTVPYNHQGIVMHACNAEALNGFSICPNIESFSMPPTDSITSSTTTTTNSDIDYQLESMQSNLKPGWTIHSGKEGRLYYCNHLTKTSGWLPSCEDWSKLEELAYGWEKAIDAKGRTYYINHLNKSCTYETPESIKYDEEPPQPRTVVLNRSATRGFGFVAGSERPVIVRFVTEDGPSINKLQPGDQILAINGENVKDAPRDRVIQLVRACETQVTLLVCQPCRTVQPGRKSTLLSASKRAKLKSRPCRVRFAESVLVNGAPLFPPSAFSLGEICVPPMANVLKVFLENGQTKSFKYDSTTTVQDVVRSLLDKLCFNCADIFGLVLEHVKSLKRNKLTLLDPEESLAKIASRPGVHKLRCLFRVNFVPISASDLAKKDLNALDYLYMQCCNDVTQERFAPELQPEVALRLAALNIHQHALANNIAPAKLTAKLVEREFGLERFVPISLFEGMKRKELRRLISHFLKLNVEIMGSTGKMLTQLQSKLHYLDIIACLPSYGAKCFSTNPRDGLECVLLVSPRFGLSQISNSRNALPQPVASLEDLTHVVVQREDDVMCTVTIYLQGDRNIKYYLDERDAEEFSLCLAGYCLTISGRKIVVVRDLENQDEDNAPSYLSQHLVLPASWSYLPAYHDRAHSISFVIPPVYHPSKPKTLDICENIGQIFMGNSLCDKNMNSSMVQSKMPFISTATTDLDLHSVMATELLEDAKDNEPITNSLQSKSSIEANNQQVLRRVQEMQKMVENSEQYLNEHGECSNSKSTTLINSNPTVPMSSTSVNSKVLRSESLITKELDEDCNSLNSSKQSSNEMSTALKRGDSLILLAETIKQDLSGINQSLKSIDSNQSVSALHRPIKLNTTCSPRPERKLNGYSQLLIHLQALGTDLSQSESDSESVTSPSSSPTIRRPLNDNQNSNNRYSFGLHSPDNNTIGHDSKSDNIKDYLKQLQGIHIVSQNEEQEVNIAEQTARKLSEVYGFEINPETFVEIDNDFIDLRAIPPPRTPDELDSLSLLNTAPKGFDDINSKKIQLDTNDSDLDRFLEHIVVAPPTYKTAPAKELTPEEIMSYIIPPPPTLDEQTQNKLTNCSTNKANESLYSNTTTSQIKMKANQSITQTNDITLEPPAQHVIEYASVERKSKFSCCSTKSKKEQTVTNGFQGTLGDAKLPPRHHDAEHIIPDRPPKSVELIQRFSPKKTSTGLSNGTNSIISYPSNHTPPKLPPRVNYLPDNRQNISQNLRSPSLTRDYNQSTASNPVKQQKSPMHLPRLSLSARTQEAKSTSDSQIQTATLTSVNNNTLELPYKSNREMFYHQQNIGGGIGEHFSSSLRMIGRQRSSHTLLSSPQISRKTDAPKLIYKGGHIINVDNLMAKTDVAMAGLLIKLDQIAAQCTAAQSTGGGTCIDEEKFQKARNELTEQTLLLVTASKYLVVALSDITLNALPEHLTSCLTAIRRITELTQDMTRHTSSPLQTRNIVLKVHDVASNFRELVLVQIGTLGAGKLALQAECLANVLSTLLRSLRIFSP